MKNGKHGGHPSHSNEMFCACPKGIKPRVFVYGGFMWRDDRWQRRGGECSVSIFHPEHQSFISGRGLVLLFLTLFYRWKTEHVQGMELTLCWTWTLCQVSFLWLFLLIFTGTRGRFIRLWESNSMSTLKHNTIKVIYTVHVQVCMFMYSVVYVLHISLSLFCLLYLCCSIKVQMRILV